MIFSNCIFSLDKSGWLSTMAKWNVNYGKGLDNIYFIFLYKVYGKKEPGTKVLGRSGTPVLCSVSQNGLSDIVS